MSSKIAITIETIGNSAVLRMSNGECLTWGFIIKHVKQLHSRDAQIVRNIIHAGYRHGADLTKLAF